MLRVFIAQTLAILYPGKPLLNIYQHITTSLLLPLESLGIHGTQFQNSHSSGTVLEIFMIQQKVWGVSWPGQGRANLSCNLTWGIMAYTWHDLVGPLTWNCFFFFYINKFHLVERPAHTIYLTICLRAYLLDIGSWGYWDRKSSTHYSTLSFWSPQSSRARVGTLCL